MKKQTKFHPVLQSADGVFNTASGQKVDINKPTIAMIKIEDIAASLSKICRFGGHSSAFYSVAQHSVMVAAMAPPDIKLEALLHDAPETYLGDVIKPLKIILGWPYANLEGKFERAIAKKFKLDYEDPTYSIIKGLDEEALGIEHQAFIVGDVQPMIKILKRLDMLDVERFAWTHEVAEREFLKAYERYKR